ncbi:hypothetical protein J1N35_001373 [Gossypium stocksii]|uniref:Uncharacterized protein n=1 Tax=Gossypium stocksii TaxID=47602 RepID=A0A9D3WJS7_9ROSI|nr:hypothetical protein J1N35_001373 [Gossypium stocksii]
MSIFDNNSHARCLGRGMKIRIKVVFQKTSIWGLPPFNPNQAPNKLHLCHIQFQKQPPSIERNKHQSAAVGCTD